MSKRSPRTSPSDAAAAVKDKTTDAAAAVKDKTTDAAAAVKDKAIAATDSVIDSIAAVTDAAEKRSRQTKKATRKRANKAAKQAQQTVEEHIPDAPSSHSHRARNVLLGLIAAGGAAFAAAKSLRGRSDDPGPARRAEPVAPVSSTTVDPVAESVAEPATDAAHAKDG